VNVSLFINNSLYCILVQIQGMLGGRGGGKPENAQATGSNVAAMSEAMSAAGDFARQKLGLTEAPVIKEPQKE